MPAPARNDFIYGLQSWSTLCPTPTAGRAGASLATLGFRYVRPLCLMPAMTVTDTLLIAIMPARPGQHLLTKVLMWFMYSCWQWLSVKKESLLPPAHQSAYCSHR